MMSNSRAQEATKSILVIEDDEGIRETLKMSLELEGYKVFTAVNGKDGLESLRTIPRPGLILLDLMMPVMNGWEFVEAVQTKDGLATIPVVVVTAYGVKEDSIKANAVIRKPVNLDMLLETARQWCGNPSGDAA